MPAMTYRLRWPDQTVSVCYSPSLVIQDFFDAGASSPLPDFMARIRSATQIASDRVAAKFGFACSRANDQLAEIERLAERFSIPSDMARFARMAERIEDSFFGAFWNRSAGCLYDVVDYGGPDAAIRPNQIFAVSLPFPLLDSESAQSVVQVVERFKGEPTFAHLTLTEVVRSRIAAVAARLL